MRTAHLIVSVAAFAVWLAAVIVYCVVCDNSATEQWYLYGPAAVMPSFWCLYAWFAAHRADAKITQRLTLLAAPVLLCGLGVALVVVGDMLPALQEGSRRIGMGVAMVGGCCWEPAAICGLISFIWAVVHQVKGHLQPHKEQ